jgi:hypothetical protein
MELTDDVRPMNFEMTGLEVTVGTVLISLTPIVLTFLVFNFSTAFVVEAWAAMKLLMGAEAEADLRDLSMLEVRPSPAQCPNNTGCQPVTTPQYSCSCSDDICTKAEPDLHEFSKLRTIRYHSCVPKAPHLLADRNA